MKWNVVVLAALCVGLSLGAATQARADVITATLTADNHYGLYVGNADGSSINFIGRNEKGDGGNPGDYNWSLPETFTFAANAGSYVYVLAWTDDNAPRSWIGQFTSSNGGSLFSNLTQWQYTVGSGPNPGRDGDVPALGTVKSDIAKASWSTPLAAVDHNDSAIWGTIPGISPDAKFIWSDTVDGDSPTDDNYVIFRAVAPAPVPVPPSLFLLAPGLLGLMGIKRRLGR